MASFTSNFHSTSYPAISPETPANTQAGRCVLITGGSEGIGFAIAAAFRAAGASQIIILGRREDALKAAVDQLDALPGASDAKVTFQVCDIRSESGIESTWQQISSRGVAVDVMVLNAAATAHGPLAGDIVSACWDSFETNVLANLRMTKHLLHSSNPSSKKVLLNISSFIVHSNPAPSQGAYSASKTGFASALQHLADEMPVDQVQILNIHPGAVLTVAARRGGYDETTLPWDDANLPAHFCVWASTDAAKFLHGKFVWANWDVEELLKRQSEIEGAPGMLRVGLQGCEFVDIRTIFQKISGKDK